MTKSRKTASWLLILQALACLCPAEDDPQELVELDPLEVVATWPELATGIMPTDRDVVGVFGRTGDILQTPRSVTIVTPELLKRSGVDGFEGLSELCAGADRVNYWGIAGSPQIRGTHAGVYFNGMLRAWQRNEMPTSFGSTETIQIVKGPVPAHLALSPVGGYVEMIPKSPFFDKERHSITLSAGSFDRYKTQLDYGGPTEILGHKAAWRVSLGVQESASHYDNVRDDYASLYATGLIQLDERTSVTIGGEFYDYRSNEVSGWNRITQNLVDNSQYVIGEPIGIVDSDWGGTANRTLVTSHATTGIANFAALVVPAAVVEQALANGTITQAAADAMLDLSNPDDRARAYGQPLPSTGQRDTAYDASASASLDAALAKAYASGQSTSGYRYTKEYFDLGGTVFTTKIDSSTILADPDDHADSKDALFFADWKRIYGEGRRVTNKVFIERLHTRKSSSYGFALNSDQFILADTLLLEIPSESLATAFTLGADARYNWVEVTQDFFAEPFSRRDISTGEISPNSIVHAGSYVAPDGKNLWSPGRGANLECNLYQAGIFAVADSQVTDRLRIFTSFRVNSATWRTKLADDVDRRTEAILESSRHEGDTIHCNASLNPVFRLCEGLYLYGAAQAGTALAPGDAGTIVGEANFTKANMLEAGVKGSLLQKRLYFSFGAYKWEQSRYSDIDARALPLKGEGVECEATLDLGPIAFTGAFTHQKVRLCSENIGYGALPMTEEDWALGAGAFIAASNRVLENNPDLVYEGVPRNSAHLVCVIDLPDGWAMTLGPHLRDACYASMDRTVRLPSSTVWNTTIYWRSEHWELSLRVQNLFNEDYFLASDPVFSGNVLVTKGEPRNWFASVTYTY